MFAVNSQCRKADILGDDYQVGRVGSHELIRRMGVGERELAE